jgi:cytoskeleton protein RodZ
MESLGKKLQEARLRKKISLDEAARVTKIRASRLQDIEAEDFSNFSSLAYAKGFLLIYGKFLEVDVTPYLDAFETSREVSVDGYSYLQNPPSAAPPPRVRRQRAKRPALLPFIIAVGVLVLGLYLVKLLLDIQRITPARPALGAIASAAPSPAASPSENIIAPRGIPIESPPVSEARATLAPTAAPQAPAPLPSEPEVRRAEPVHPEDFASPNVPPPPLANRVQITPMRKTFLRVSVDGASEPAFNGWLDPADPPLTFRGRHITVKVLERGAVQITKNGAALAADDIDVTFE